MAMVSPNLKKDNAALGGWSHDAFIVGGAFKLLVLLTLVFLAAAVTIMLLYLSPETKNYVLPVQLVLLVTGLTIIIALTRRVYREVLKPMDSVRSWASRMRQGDYSAEISLPQRGEFAGLLQDLSEMGRWYRDVSLEGEDNVSEQLREMARKTRLLEVLYDIAASISASRDLKDVLVRFLRLSADITNAKSAVVRLTTPDGDMRLVDAIHENREGLEERVAMADVIPGHVARVRSVYVTDPDRSPDFRDISDGSGTLECVTVPLLYRGDVQGAYQLLMDQTASSLSYDLHELFTSIGHHLGLAIHKAHLDEEAKKQSIFRERLTLAHELHDSLAQSMVSLRFQCKALEGSVQRSDLDLAAREVIKLRHGVDKANVELRELLAHFRAPVDERDLVSAISDQLRKFREESKILVFSQFDCDRLRPPMHVQRQVLRIVQEALANIHKHADAHIVRLLLRCPDEGQCYLLIEDDGHGFEGAGSAGGTAGDHIGLKVMQERAAHIDAELSVESEPGEGTRVDLHFSWDGQ